MGPTTLTAATLGLVVAVMAHGDDDNMDMAGGNSPVPNSDSYPPTYFALADHAGVMYAHIAVMLISWVVVLPAGEN